ncbi:hypothetical protein MMC30_007033 [Trapelia coarctata]|nr:hypothetical protein [Trapelia coarctata]
MLFGTKFLALVAALSSVTLAAPSPNPIPAELERRNCPRYDIGAAKTVAEVYLGKGNNKSRQVERLIEEVIALLVGPHPKCDPKHVYLWCEEDGDHYKRDAEAEANNPPPKDDDCDKKYPYKRCHIKCKSHNYC